MKDKELRVLLVEDNAGDLQHGEAGKFRIATSLPCERKSDGTNFTLRNTSEFKICGENGLPLYTLNAIRAKEFQRSARTPTLCGVVFTSVQLAFRKGIVRILVVPLALDRKFTTPNTTKLDPPRLVEDVVEILGTVLRCVFHNLFVQTCP